MNTELNPTPVASRNSNPNPKCIVCHAEKTSYGSRCDSCADTHRIKNRQAYYLRKYGTLPSGDLTRGMRPSLRDRILELMSDGQTRTSAQVRDALKWEKRTSIPKTLSDISDFLRASGNERQLEKMPLGNSKRNGVAWRLIDTPQEGTPLAAPPAVVEISTPVSPDNDFENETLGERQAEACTLDECTSCQ